MAVKVGLCIGLIIMQKKIGDVKGTKAYIKIHETGW
jgi:hypothetical protein